MHIILWFKNVGCVDLIVFILKFFSKYAVENGSEDSYKCMKGTLKTDRKVPGRFAHFTFRTPTPSPSRFAHFYCCDNMRSIIKVFHTYICVWHSFIAK